MSKKNKRIIYAVLSAAAMTAVMVAIFCFSGQNGEKSSQASNSVGKIVLGILNIEVPEGASPSDVPIVFGFNIRNFAHIFLYLLLGATSFLFVLSLFGLRGRYGAFTPLLVSAGAAVISFEYACFDELHQYFIGGRTASMRDVGIDAIGFVFSIAVSLGIYFLCLAINNRKSAGS